MTKYKSFDNQTNKIRQTWESAETNKNSVADLKKITLNFNSFNFHDRTEEEVIYTNRLTTSGEKLITSINLINFPEWAVNHIIVVPTINSTSGFPIKNVVNSPFLTFQQGKLKEGDIQFSTSFHHWIAKIENDNYRLKIFIQTNLRVVTEVTGLGFATESIPMYLNMTLKFRNPREYENNEEKKQ